MISHAGRMRITLAAAIVTLIAVSGESAYAQPNASNEYRLVDNWGKLPAGRTWGKLSNITFDRDGNLWVFERCGGGSCSGSGSNQPNPKGASLDPILKFDSSGNLVKSFGKGMFIKPHGIRLDKGGNVWVTDQLGQTVVKFSPEGKVLLTLGKAGVTGAGPDTFHDPTDIVFAPNGDIFVSDGHGLEDGVETNARIVKFSKDGKFLKTWGKKGSAPGEIDDPHAIAMDSKGRLFECDRNNNRIQIFDQDGKFLEEWKQFGRPGGIFIDAKDTIYVTDSESDAKTNPGFKQGIRIGSAKDGVVKAFLPGVPPQGKSEGGPVAVAVDANGNIYWGEGGAHSLREYAKK